MSIGIFLKQPYPSPYPNLKIPVIIGFALSLVMLFMQPFGLNSIHFPYKALFLSGYGLVTFLVLFINLMFVIRLFSEFEWNIFKQILWSCWVVFGIGLTNYAYTLYFISDIPFSVLALIVFQVYTFFIAIVPITFLVLIRQNKLLKLNERGAQSLSENLNHSPEQELPTNERISFVAANGKNQINIQAHNLAFIESVGNYIHVYHQVEERIIESTLRSSISKAEIELVNHNNFLKCHRAFIVNVNYIKNAKGNAQGYKLAIKNTDKEVYVSRQYAKVLKEALK